MRRPYHLCVSRTIKTQLSLRLLRHKSTQFRHVFVDNMMKNTSDLSCQELSGTPPLPTESNAADFRPMLSNQITFAAQQIDSVAQSLDPAFCPENQNTPPDQFIGALRQVLSGLGNLFNSLAESPARNSSFRDLEMQECSSRCDISRRRADESFGRQDGMYKGTLPLMGF